jgi:hypothetical protein
MANEDAKNQGAKSEEKAKKDEGQNRGFSYTPGEEGVTKMARLHSANMTRGSGDDFNPDHLAAGSEEAQVKGYRGYSPTGPGENDAPFSKNKGVLLAFDEPKGAE